MKRSHDLALDRSVARLPRSIHPERALGTDTKRRIGERRIVALRATSSAGAAVVSVGILIGGCSKVNVTPLGSTREGRQQFEITCNKHASDSGSCHEKALDACGGDYETLGVDSTGPRAVSYYGQLFTAPGYRVLLIACNTPRRADPPVVRARSKA